VSVLFEVLALGLRALWRNRLRSLLTMLGMIFGVGSVIAMLSVGAGARSEILSRIGELGVRNVILNSVKPPESNRPEGSEQSWRDTYGLRFEDASYIEDVIHTVSRVLRVNRARERAWYRGHRAEATVLGVEPAYLDAFGLEVERGRRFEELDQRAATRVCLVRRNLLRELAPSEDPLGLWLQLGRHSYQVIGILADEELRSHTKKALSIDAQAHEVYVPYSSAMRTFGTVNYVSRGGSTEYSKVELDQIVVQVARAEDVPSTAQMISSMLGSLHDRPDYEIVVPLELLRQREETSRVFHLVMLSIAAISLVVGGIGIANIMLASVHERTREIGIRRALGARRGDIQLEFLAETVLIAALGGLLGCLAGMLGSRGISELTHWPAIVPTYAVLVALSISCLVGILSGLFPARRAALLDPIAALRHE
jgi:putative ABC transport system permease protein